MKKTRYIYTVLCIVALFFLTGCSEHDVQLPSDGVKTVNWTIGVTFPEALLPATRAFDRTDFEFETLHVAVFAEAGGVFFLEQFVRADNTAPEWNSENNCWDFGVQLMESTEPRRLHIIANYPGLTMGFGEESQLIGRLLTDANTVQHDVYWNYVDIDKITEGFELQVQRVPLVRNFAQIRVNVEPKEGVDLTEKFRLDGYAIYNVPTRGTVAPYNSKDGTFANYVVNDNGTLKCESYVNLFNLQGYEGNEPYDDGTFLSRTITDDDFLTPDKPFYLYERSNRTATSPTSMIIKGKYAPDSNFDDVEDTYYKLDFIYVDEDTKTNVYFNILRNFIYTVNLKDVTGEGYPTIQEAIEKPASNNVAGDVALKDYTNVSDGMSRLFVSTTYLVFTSEEPVDIYYQHRSNIEVKPNIIDNSVGSGGSVTVAAPVGDVLKSAVIATKDETAGGRSGWRKITLTPNKPEEGKVLVQEITVATQDLQRQIVLVLRNPYDLAVKVIPKHVQKVQKTPLAVKVTIPGGIPSSLFPLKFFISTDNNTIDPKPGTNVPAETMSGTYGFIKEISLHYYKEATPTGDGRDVPVKESNGDVSFITDFRTNCTESAATVYVSNQYFNTGSASFDNEEIYETITLGTSTAVTIQQTLGRYPQTIYNNGNNNGTVSNVKVYQNGVYKGDIAIDRDNVVSGITFEDSEGLDLSDEVTFVFSDKHYTGSGWSSEAVEYSASCTLNDIKNGTTLTFESPAIRTYEIVIPTTTKVTVQTETYTYGRNNNSSKTVYPYNIHNVSNHTSNTKQNNNGTESVTVSVNGATATITIDLDNVTKGATVEIPGGASPTDIITFTFSDKYCESLVTNGNNLRGYNFSSSSVTYTFKCTVEEFQNGVTLNFKR